MGLAIAADSGLLLAQLLQEHKPQLKWQIGKGPKTYHSYNLPVLTAFKNGDWDLVFSSISKNGYSPNELKHPYDWFSFYNDLKNKVL